MTAYRICFLTGTLSAFAGAERATATLANELARRGHDVQVLCLWGDTCVFPLAAQVRHTALFPERVSFRTYYLAAVRRIRDFLQRQRIQVLIDVDTMLAWFTQPATLGLPLRRIAWEHSTYAQDLGRKSRRIARGVAAARDDAVVVLTSADQQHWQRQHPRANAAIVAIPNALALSVPATPNTLDQPLMLAVGRLTAAKGFDLLLQAWARAAPDAGPWRLRIVGDGELAGSLRDLAAQLQITGSVEWVPATPDIAAHFASASVYCMTSRQESFGLVLIEAQAFGLPVAAFDSDIGPRTLLTPNEDSLLVPAFDLDEYASALVRLMRDEPLRKALGRTAFANAHRYTPQTVGDTWDHLLASLMRSQTQPA